MGEWATATPAQARAWDELTKDEQLRLAEILLADSSTGHQPAGSINGDWPDRKTQDAILFWRGISVGWRWCKRFSSRIEGQEHA